MSSLRSVVCPFLPSPKPDVSLSLSPSRTFQIEKESFLSDHTPEGDRIVSLSPDSQETSTAEQVQLLHSALRQCLGLLHCLILREEEEMGELEGDYEAMRKNVRFRLEHLLTSTKDLVETKDVTIEVTPDDQCNEV